MYHFVAVLPNGKEYFEDINKIVTDTYQNIAENAVKNLKPSHYDVKPIEVLVSELVIKQGKIERIHRRNSYVAYITDDHKTFTFKPVKSSSWGMPYVALINDFCSETKGGGDTEIHAYFISKIQAVDLCNRLRAITTLTFGNNQWAVIDLVKQNIVDFTSDIYANKFVEIRENNKCIGYVLKENLTSLYLILALLNQGSLFPGMEKKVVETA